MRSTRVRVKERRDDNGAQERQLTCFIKSVDDVLAFTVLSELLLSLQCPRLVKGITCVIEDLIASLGRQWEANARPGQGESEQGSNEAHFESLQPSAGNVLGVRTLPMRFRLHATHHNWQENGNFVMDNTSTQQLQPRKEKNTRTLQDR